MTNLNHAPTQLQHAKPQQLVVGKEIISTDKVAAKLLQDIAFLSDRIGQLQSQRNPNPMILKVYQDMLESRHAILEWLEQRQAS